MILLSLLLVLLSLGLLIVGLAAASQALVWASIGSSLAAGLCLAIAVLQRRRVAPDGGSADAFDAGEDVSTRVPGAGAGAGEPPSGAYPGAALPGATAGDATGPPAQGGGPGVPPAVPLGEPAAEETYPDPPDEPPVEEDVSAPDALRVIDADADVYVVDGRPRYHMQDCPHLVDREAIPLAVAEAREAGFTPCSRCKPDSTLAAQVRAAAAAPPPKPPADKRPPPTGSGDAART